MRHIGDRLLSRGLRGRLNPSKNSASFWRWAGGATLVLGFLTITFVAVAASGTSGPTVEVNPMIGTGKGPGAGINSSNENLFPGAVMPFGMVQLSPDTESHGYGYHYYQDAIQGFSMTHMSGVGCSNEGDVFFTATTGPVQTQVSEFQSRYSHSQEAASRGYYRVHLSRWDVDAELTATDRTGVAQFSFPAGKPANILVPISHTLNQTMAAHVQVIGDRQIAGYVVNQIFCGSHQTYKVYFLMTFDRPFSQFGTWNSEKPDVEGKLANGNREVPQTWPGKWVGAYASWPTAKQAQTITAKVAISYVDPEGARNNLQTEAAGKNFFLIRQQAAAAWNKALSVIDVSGGSQRERTIFYTALYHSLMMPSIFSDADGRYLGFDGKTQHVASGHLIYANYSGWDVYRSEFPLLALIEPRRMEDMAQSIVLMYKQGGWVGRWPQINRYTNVMAGSPLTTILCTAWLDGLHGFDMNLAWQGMMADATQVPPPGKPYTGQAGMEWINRLHYAPNDKVKYGSVSQIQEDAIAYASLYRVAVKLHKTNEAKMLYERALYYRNVFNPQDRFFRPRNSDGGWVQNFDPAQNDHGFIEGSGWHYQWLAPTDMAWLLHAVGLDLFNKRLTKFFDYPKPGWYGEYYNPYNEADLEAPFEFNFSGMPWESQRAVRRVLRENYQDNPNGIPGNDDAGEMSSWAVMSMMGFYSVDPASRAYELVSPVFSKVAIHLQTPYKGKDFTIEASLDPQSNAYIQSVKLDGQTHKKNWISFGNISKGGTLEFMLGSAPNKEWGSAPQDAPPSLSNEQP